MINIDIVKTLKQSKILRLYINDSNSIAAGFRKRQRRVHWQPDFCYNDNLTLQVTPNLHRDVNIGTGSSQPRNNSLFSPSTISNSMPTHTKQGKLTLNRDGNVVTGSTLSTLDSASKPCTINLSKYVLTDSELSLLEKGLTFIPTMHYTDCSQIYELQNKVIRSLKLRDYYHSSTDEGPTPRIPKQDFYIPSTWTPKDANLMPTTVDAASRMAITTEEILLPVRSRDGRRACVHNSTDNLTLAERDAIKQLYSNTDIIIKKADKGSATVIMDKSAYIAEAERQLHNTKFYTKISSPIYTENANKIRAILQNMYCDGFLTHKALQYLSPPREPRRRKFYMLPKIHKEREKWPHVNMPEGRPIVSDCNSESHRISRYIDHFIKPLSQLHETFIRDTYDFVGKIRDKPLPQGALLVTCDVTALYTNMRLDRILSTVAGSLHRHPRVDRPDKYLLQLLEITLRGNDFDFNGETYLQVCGTAMGKPDAPSQADIYLEEFDRLAQNGFDQHPDYLSRFLDDVFFVWIHGQQKLTLFQEYLNSLIEGIKVTFTASTDEVNFLDTTVYRRKTDTGDVIGTKVYFKPTDTHQLLHKQSFHPKHTCRGVLKSQFIRFRRISTTEEDYQEACKVLLGALGKRGYSKRLMRRMRSDVWRNYQREFTRTNADTTVFPLIVPYNSIGTTLSRRWRETISELNLMQDTKIVTAYTVGRNLSKFLIRASMLTNHSNRHVSSTGLNVCRRCTSVRCKACNFIQETSRFGDHQNPSKFQVMGTISCSTRDLIYVVTCRRCNLQYVGETGRSLGERITDHLSAIRTKKQTPIGLHFNLPDHSVNNFCIAGVEHVNRDDENYRRLRESVWRIVLKTSHPHGINFLKPGHLNRANTGSIGSVETLPERAVGTQLKQKRLTDYFTPDHATV